MEKKNRQKRIMDGNTRVLLQTDECCPERILISVGIEMDKRSKKKESTKNRKRKGTSVYVKKKRRDGKEEREQDDSQEEKQRDNKKIKTKIKGNQSSSHVLVLYILDSACSLFSSPSWISALLVTS